jgi:hypothetical protein
VNRLLHAVTIFLGSFLLFWIQPLFSKMVLPIFGGSPQVWNTCLVFFQITLLLGYVYAHLLSTRIPIRFQVIVAGVVIAMGAFFGPPDSMANVSGAAGTDAAERLLGMLVFFIGPAFLPLSANAPLIQSWFDRSRRSDEDPYALYAASNVGSLLALLVFPFVLEPRMPLGEQVHAWSALFLAWLALAVACGLRARASREAAASRLAGNGPESESPAGSVATATAGSGVSPAIAERLGWIGLAFLPSSLLMGVTTHISTDIAAVPLLWILPLALYLFTFIIAFSGRAAGAAPISSRYFPLLALPLVVWIGGNAIARTMAWVPVVLHLAVFLVAAQYCHARLAASRPAPRRLTGFYIDIALGGALGGIFNALVAPRIFNDVWEYPVAIAIAAFVVPFHGRPDRRIGPFDLILPALAACLFLGLDRVITILAPEAGGEKNFLVLGVPALVCLAGARTRLRFGLCVTVLLAAGLAWQYPAKEVIFRGRSFFGVYKVLNDRAVPFVSLTHGSTTHGGQWRVRELEAEPQTYYHPAGPVGHVYQVFAARDARSPVGAVGLGAGSMAAYAEPFREMVFFEIDPLVVKVARDTACFTYLARSRGRITVDLGDARIELAKRPERFGLLVLDAFSSDAIPVHLMTREAVRMYLARMTDTGLIAFHVSNRFLSLVPVLAAIARDEGMVAYVQDDIVRTPRFPGKMASMWVALARRDEDLGEIAHDPRWTRVVADSTVAAWTDDFSDVISRFKW